jgi:hypothetical protein
VRVVTLPTGGPRVVALFLVADRHAAVQAGGVLRVFDVRQDDAPMALELPEIVHAAAVPGAHAFVVVDGAGMLARWDHTGDHWTRSTVLPVAGSIEDVVVSSSGRFAVLDGGNASLIELERGRVVAEIPAEYGTARPCFDRLADGRELLFIAAPSYMDVRVIDCATGEDLRRHESNNSHDFCHVDFRLAAGATRLVTFGCVWAWPYDARIYDVAAWLGATTVTPSQRLPSPLVELSPLVSNTLLALDIQAGVDACTSACLETCAALAPDGDGKRPPWLAARLDLEPEIARGLDRVMATSSQALIVRAVDPVSGTTIAAAVHGVPSTPEAHVHYADGHRVVLAGPRLLVCDVHGAQVDHGALGLGAGALTRVTRDASIVVVAAE